MNTELIARARSLRNHYLGKTEAFRNIVSDVIDELTAALEAAQPAGEPVAWQSTSFGESLLTLEQKNGNYFEYSDEFLASHTIQLYTHPAPQVPMTDGQIKELSEAIWGSELDYQHTWEIEFARAIETFHKIGVKP